MNLSHRINHASMTKKRVVIIGAGFGGLAVAYKLKHADAEVVVIDRTNYHLFQPLLYQVATAALSPADIASATRSLLNDQSNTTVIMDVVTGIDSATRQVRLENGASIAYDMLVLAIGASYSYFGRDDWAKYSLVLKTLEDATAIRGRLLSAFEMAEGETNAEEIRRLLTFVVVGGGPTGVELAGNIAELARTTLARDFRRIDPSSARVVLVEAEKRLLLAFPEDLGRYVENALRSLNVDVRCGERVTALDEVGLSAGSDRIDAANVFWAAGTRARPAADWLGADAAHNGAIYVGPDCSVPGHDGVFAIGDCASQLGTDGKPLPGLGAVAKQQGEYLGALIAGKLKGQTNPKPFRYKDLGTMAIVGRYRAVAKLPFTSFTGPLAWVMWSLVHLILLMDFRSRAAVYWSWCWSWLTYGRGARLIINLQHFKPPPDDRADV
jgi:NADH dehydrogenase